MISETVLPSEIVIAIAAANSSVWPAGLRAVLDIVRCIQVRLKATRRVDCRAQHVGDLVEHHDGEIELDYRKRPRNGRLDGLGQRTQHMLHQRHDEARAAAENEIGCPVAQRTVHKGAVAAEAGDEIVHQPRLTAGIGDGHVQASLALDDVGEEFAVDLAEGGGEFSHGCLVAEAAGQLGEEGAIHRLYLSC